jgi:hypothetical protein
MLQIVSSKILPLISLTALTIGCGKKITDKEGNSLDQRLNQELPATYSIVLDGSSASKQNYDLPMATQFEVPRYVNVRKGNSLNKKVDIVFDLNEWDSDDFQFKCTYIASNNPSKMMLNDCEDYFGQSLGDVSGHLFSLRAKNIIQIKFSGENAPDLLVEAFFIMNWL